MAANYFDQFDPQGGNYFDQFDEESSLRRDYARAGKRGFADMGRFVGRGLGAVGVDDLGESVKDYWTQVSQANQPSAESEARAWYNPAKIGERVIEFGASQLPMLAVGGAVGAGAKAVGLGARAAGLLGTAAGAPLGGAMEGLGHYDERLAEAVPPEQAAREAWKFGLASTALNAIPLSRMLSRTPGRLLTGAAEAITETAEEPTSAFIAGKSPEQILERTVEGAKQVGPAAFLLGAAGGTSAPNVPNVTDREAFVRQAGLGQTPGSPGEPAINLDAVANEYGLGQKALPAPPTLTRPFERPGGTDWVAGAEGPAMRPQEAATLRPDTTPGSPTGQYQYAADGSVAPVTPEELVDPWGAPPAPLERLKTDADLRQSFAALKGETGWDTVGGRSMGKAGPGLFEQRDVEGSTPWLPKHPWFKDVPTDDGGRRPSEEAIQRVIDLTLEGKPLGKQQQRVAEYLAEVAAERIKVPPLMTADELRQPLAARPAPVWFSQSLKLVEQAGTPRATGEQWLGYLRNKGAKAEELKWTGADEWLAQQKGAVSKQDLAEYLRSHQVEVQEVLKDGSQEGVASLLDNAPKFANWQLPGGENYRELLLTLPAKDPAPAGRIEPLPNGKFLVVYPGLQDQLFATRREAELETARLGAKFNRESDGAFRGGHYDEPNVLAHVRFNDRTDADGKRVLFVEEIQSDWHQKGRKEGYASARRIPKDQLVATNVNAVGANIGYWRVNDKNGNFIGNVLDQTLTAEQAIDEVSERLASRPETTGLAHAVPDAPFKTTWPDLALKRMIRWAAENGYDRIAWTPGEVQADRYDLSKQLDAVIYRVNKDGTYEINARKKGGDDQYREVVSIADFVPTEKLDDYVGKEVAEKMRAGEGERKGAERTLSGLDLKVGGEGMRGFYDKILVDAANKLGKRFGAKVGRTRVKTRNPTYSNFYVSTTRGVPYQVIEETADGREIARGDFQVIGEARKEQKRLQAEAKANAQAEQEAVHSLDITPQMRESVMQGQPLMRRDLPEKRVSIGFDLDKTLAPIVAKWGANAPKLKIVERATDLPPNILAATGEAALGAYDAETGTVLLVRQNLRTPEDALRTLAHEAVGHYGLLNLVGPKWQDLTAQVRDLAKRDKQLGEITAEVAQSYADKPEEIQTLEVIARLAETRPKHGVVMRAFAMLRDALRRLGFDLKFSRTDLIEMLRKAEQFNERGGPQPGALAAREVKGPRLSALHNLSAENLKFADQIGGLAAPSIGVVREGMGIRGMGEITLIGRKPLLDPEQVPVFDADAYTATHPRAEYPKAKSAAAQKVADAFRPFAKLFDADHDLQTLWDNAVNSPNPEETVSRLLDSAAAQAWFLSTKGVQAEPVMVKRDIELPFVTMPAAQAYRKSGGGFNFDYHSPEHRAFSEAMRQAIQEYVAKGSKKSADVRAELGKMWLNKAFDEEGFFAFGKTFAIERSFDAIGKERVSYGETRERMKQAMQGREPEFASWLNSMVFGLHGAPFIKVGRQKRPYTIENIVEKMTTGPIQAKQQLLTFGEGKARATSAKRISSLTEMRNRAEWQMGDEDAITAQREAAKQKMEQYRDAVIRYYTGRTWEGRPDTWAALDASMRAIATVAKRNHFSTDAMRAALARESFSGVSMSALERGVEAARTMQEAPVPYFEAKPQRAVSLNEFAGAVIPESASEETKAILTKHGIPFKTYRGEKNQTAAADAFRKELAASVPDVLASRPQPMGRQTTATGSNAPPQADPGIGRQTVEVGGGEYTTAPNLGVDPATQRVILDVLNMPQTDQRVAAERVQDRVSNEETIKRARAMLGEEFGGLLNQLWNRVPRSAANADTLAALAQLVNTHAVAVRQAVEAYDGSAESLQRMMAAKEQLGISLAPFMGYRTEAGRALQILQAVQRDYTDALQIFEAIGGGTQQSMQDFARRVKAAGSVEEVLKLTKAAYQPSWWDQFYEYWINGLLSGPWTHFVNIASNGLFNALEIGTEGLVSMVSPNVSGRATLARVSGQLEGTKLGLANALRAFQTEEPQLTARTQIESEHHRAIPGQLGRAVRLPGRFLLAEDEMAKAIAFTGELHRIAMERALQQSPQDPHAAFQQALAGLANDRTAQEQARRYADRATFQTPLGAFGNMGLYWLNKSKVGRILIPFVRTPTNILKRAMEYTPAGVAMEQVRKDLGGTDKAARDLALGRMVVGSAVMVAVASAVLQGMITGAGPDDERERELWQRTGRKPYSIKVGDEWIRYNRFEPVGMLIGVAADLAEIGEAAPSKSIDEIGTMLMTSVALNLGDKTFLRGVTDFANAYSDPQRYLAQWARGMAGTAIPNIAAQTARATDPYVREARTLTDSLKGRIPGARSTLSPKLDVAGEPIERSVVEPLASSTQRKDPLAETMLALGALKGAPQRSLQIGGLRYEMTSAEFEGYKQFVQQARWRVLTPLAQSPQFRELARQNPLAAKDYIETNWDKIGRAARDAYLLKHPELVRKIVNQPRAQAGGSLYAE